MEAQYAGTSSEAGGDNPASKRRSETRRHHQHRGVLVFSAPTVKDLISENVRLPPTYIGVRRIRPSNQVYTEVKSQSRTEQQTEEVVYKIIDETTGVERRMNTQEKKEAKLKLRREKAEAKKKRKLEASLLEVDSRSSDEAAHQPSVPPHHGSGKSYHQLQVSTSVLEEELADLRGDRDGVPPIMLSPPMASEAFRIGALEAREVVELSEHVRVVLDDSLASRWATKLKSNMTDAEEVRSKEDMRAMPYQLVPEVWTRLRPQSLPRLASDTETSSSQPSTNDDPVNGCPSKGEGLSPSAPSIKPTGEWSFITIRDRRELFDDDAALVMSVLHRNSELHVSCGAKFGCDLLLYDGRRDERHAFAGLRIIERTSDQLPLPSTYDLTGYVRGLNTAGKLALLATVERDEQCARVAFVDLALEKILSTASRKCKKPRREIGNLTKHR